MTDISASSDIDRESIAKIRDEQRLRRVNEFIKRDTRKSRDTTKKSEKKEVKENKQKDYGLFSNKALRDSFDRLPQKEKDYFRSVGEYMYANDYTGTLDDEIDRSYIYVSQSIKSGLHPSSLTEDEIGVMKSKEGDKWYSNYGYTEVDLTREE